MAAVFSVVGDHLSELEKEIRIVFGENGIGDLLFIDGVYDFDLGLEIALLWVDKLCEHLSKPETEGGILESIKAVFKNESIVLLQKRGESVSVVFSDFALSDEALATLCCPDGLYGKLARIRFTRCLRDDAGDLAGLPREFPKVVKLLAVPLFLGGAPSGCLAVSSHEPEKVFTKTHAMVLSLAASILSLARTFDGLRETSISNNRK